MSISKQVKLWKFESQVFFLFYQMYCVCSSMYPYLVSYCFPLFVATDAILKCLNVIKSVSLDLATNIMLFITSMISLHKYNTLQYKQWKYLGENVFKFFFINDIIYVYCVSPWKVRLSNTKYQDVSSKVSPSLIGTCAQHKIWKVDFYVQTRK